MDIGTKGVLYIGSNQIKVILREVIPDEDGDRSQDDMVFEYHPDERKRIFIEHKPNHFMISRYRVDESFEEDSGIISETSASSSLSQEPVQNITKGEVHSDFGDCVDIQKVTYKDKHSLAIYTGKNLSTGKFYVALGLQKPWKLTEDQFAFMVSGLLASIEMMSKLGHTSNNDSAQILSGVTGDIHIARSTYSNSAHSSSEDQQEVDSEKQQAYMDLKKAIYDHENDGSDQDTEIQEIQKKINDVRALQRAHEAAENEMTEEEREKQKKDLERREMELMAQKNRLFEKRLLGKLEEEEKITYDYNYFKAIHRERGMQALKEELAKIPKEERRDIIEQIKSEHNLKKQQQDNEKTTD